MQWVYHLLYTSSHSYMSRCENFIALTPVILVRITNHNTTDFQVYLSLFFTQHRLSRRKVVVYSDNRESRLTSRNWLPILPLVLDKIIFKTFGGACSLQRNRTYVFFLSCFTLSLDKGMKMFRVIQSLLDHRETVDPPSSCHLLLMPFREETLDVSR